MTLTTLITLHHPHHPHQPSPPSSLLLFILSTVLCRERCQWRSTRGSACITCYMFIYHCWYHTIHVTISLPISNSICHFVAAYFTAYVTVYVICTCLCHIYIVYVPLSNHCLHHMLCVNISFSSYMLVWFSLYALMQFTSEILSRIGRAAKIIVASEEGAYTDRRQVTRHKTRYVPSASASAPASASASASASVYHHHPRVHRLSPGLRIEHAI